MNATHIIGTKTGSIELILTIRSFIGSFLLHTNPSQTMVYDRIVHRKGPQPKKASNTHSVKDEV
jgi:hypothetical protein